MFQLLKLLKEFSPTLSCVVILYCILDEHTQCYFVACLSQVSWTKVYIVVKDVFDL